MPPGSMGAEQGQAGRPLTRVKALGWQLIAFGRLQEDLLAVRAHQRVLLGVEAQVARDGEGRHQLGGGDKGVRCRVAVVAGRKVAVVGGDDGVGLPCKGRQYN